jgi:hypothetical protein
MTLQERVVKSILGRLVFSLIFLSSGAAHADGPVLAPNAPQDRPGVHSSQQRFEAAIAPYVARAKASYPEAKKRFLAGLPPRHYFFITTRLTDKQGRVEQVFIAVSNIREGTVTGRIWSKIMFVEGYRHGDTITFDEAGMIDWLITRPDGSEEGNVVGKFLDTYHAK